MALPERECVLCSLNKVRRFPQAGGASCPTDLKAMQCQDFRGIASRYLPLRAFCKARVSWQVTRSCNTQWETKLSLPCLVEFITTHVIGLIEGPVTLKTAPFRSGVSLVLSVPSQQQASDKLESALARGGGLAPLAVGLGNRAGAWHSATSDLQP